MVREWTTVALAARPCPAAHASGAVLCVCERACFSAAANTHGQYADMDSSRARCRNPTHAPLAKSSTVSSVPTPVSDSWAFIPATYLFAKVAYFYKSLLLMARPKPFCEGVSPLDAQAVRTAVIIL